MKSSIVCLFASVMLFTLSCANKNNNEEIKRFAKAKVHIPFDDFDIRRFSSISDSSMFERSVQIVILFSESECTRCKMKELSSIEKSRIERYNHIKTTYIVPCQKSEIENLYTLFYDFKIDGTICFDTCHAFLSANSHIPNNKLFHTFVVNDDGKVLMVGNPFQNEQMETLFKKVIANEQKRQKTKKGV